MNKPRTVGLSPRSGKSLAELNELFAAIDRERAAKRALAEVKNESVPSAQADTDPEAGHG